MLRHTTVESVQQNSTKRIFKKKKKYGEKYKHIHWLESNVTIEDVRTPTVRQQGECVSEIVISTSIFLCIDVVEIRNARHWVANFQISEHSQWTSGRQELSRASLISRISENCIHNFIFSILFHSYHINVKKSAQVRLWPQNKTNETLTKFM